MYARGFRGLLFSLYAILEFRGEDCLEHAFTIRVVIYFPRSDDRPSLRLTMTVPQRIICTADLIRLNSLDIL